MVLLYRYLQYCYPGNYSRFLACSNHFSFNNIDCYNAQPRFLPESCRYLLVNNRPQDAIKQLKKVARWNGKQMPEVELEKPEGIENEKSDIRDLFYDRSVTKVTLGSWVSWYDYKKHHLHLIKADAAITKVL